MLSGTSDLFLVDRLQQLLSGRDSKGGAVGLTLNDAAQKAAYSGLSGKVGSVTALDPSTGAILAMASAPPTTRTCCRRTTCRQVRRRTRSSRPTRTSRCSTARWFQLRHRIHVQARDDGSCAGVRQVHAKHRCPRTRLLPAPTDECESEELAGHRLRSRRQDHIDERAGSQLQQRVRLARQPAWQDAIRAQAEKFGFNKSFTVPMRSAASRYPTGLDAAQTAMSAIGQFDVTASTLQMAMVGAAIGNNGITMNPYLVKEIRGADLQIVQTASPSQFATAMSPTNAKAELNMMVDVVENGTGSNAQIGGIKVGGKTGTAETGPGRPAVAWFVAVAPADNPKVAVAVCIENAGGKSEISGNGLGAPIAKECHRSRPEQSMTIGRHDGA